MNYYLIILNNLNIMNQRAIRRIMGEMKEINKNSLEEHKIYCKFDEDNIKNMYAYMIGEENTSYHNGFYLFHIVFPDNYPICPPSVKLCTLGPMLEVRFNPNLYKNGKVCLSLIGTWVGPGWTPCNTISSVLLSIKSMILVKDAIKNEPGFEKTTSLIIDSYEDTIKHENFRVAILYILQKMPEPFEKYFRKDIEKYFVNNFDLYMKQIEEYKSLNIDKKAFVFKIYNLYIKNNYEQIQTELNKIYNNIINK